MKVIQYACNHGNRNNVTWNTKTSHCKTSCYLTQILSFKYPSYTSYSIHLLQENNILVFCWIDMVETMTSYMLKTAETTCKTFVIGFSTKFQVRYNLQTLWPRFEDSWPHRSQYFDQVEKYKNGLYCEIIWRHKLTFYAKIDHLTFWRPPFQKLEIQSFPTVCNLSVGISWTTSSIFWVISTSTIRPSHENKVGVQCEDPALTNKLEASPGEPVALTPTCVTGLWQAFNPLAAGAAYFRFFICF